MSKIIRLITLSLVFIVSFISCRDEVVGDDLLHGINYGTTTMGDDRFLYKEATSADTLALYRYTGRKLVSVIGKNYSIDFTYSGDLVSTVTHNAVLTNGDSVSISQDYVYNISGSNKLDKIIERKSIFVQPTTTTGTVVENKIYANYDLTYNANGKLATVLYKAGPIVSGQISFDYTDYRRMTLTYDTSENVLTNLVELGTISSGVLGTAVETNLFEYSVYDTQKSPYKLLSFEYLLHRLTQGSGYEGYMLSPNNPQKVLQSGTNIPIPLSTTNGDLVYDGDGYLTVGWGRVFDYRPF